MRIWVVGLGTVGRWLLRALHSQREALASRYGFGPTVVGVANARAGFVYRREGLDVATVLELASGGRPLSEHPGVQHWPTALEGLAATEADVLVEVTGSTLPDGEPGYAHMCEALGRRIPVVTSNKWPVALHGVELMELARGGGVAFRAESTVMSGTPVLSTLVEGLAGATPIGLRGILNATANFIVTEMAEGASYEDALTRAQEAGLAEPDPAADVDGYDATAKTMILAGLVFGRQLRPEQVVRRGITDIASDVSEAASTGGRVRLVATLELSGGRDGGLGARVEPLVLRREDPLAAVDGVANAVMCRAEPVGEVTIVGPGAGPELAGQGVLSDLIAVSRALRRAAR